MSTDLLLDHPISVTGLISGLLWAGVMEQLQIQVIFFI